MLLEKHLRTLGSFIKNRSKRKLLILCFKLRNEVGLEIGGPSAFFQLSSYFPVYPFAKRIDVVNFSDKTVWEGSINEGFTYQYYKNKKGYQYIDEASELNKIKEGSYDFVLSSHSLEHVANPLKAILEWKRILKKKGFLVIVLPKKENTFDHKREYTTFEHLLNDYKSNIQENDTSHFEEIINLHDIVRDHGVKSLEEFKTRTADNYKNRCIHHHVFSLPLIRQLLEYSGFSVLHQQDAENIHLVTIAQYKQ